MHPKFLHLLCDPKTDEPFIIEATETLPNGMIVTGNLVTPSGARYPIIRGIPRFVGAEHYASSFGYEWNRWPRVQFDSENIGKPMEGHTSRMWGIITGNCDSDLRGKTIVEFGCGSGRFLDVVRSKGGYAVGIDLSQAVESARQNFADDTDVLIIQGDILNPPFKDSVFDGGYTIGVLHHTPDPLGGLKALARAVRSGGWIACCVYPKGEFYDYPSVRRFRRLHNRLKSLFGYRLAMAYSYLSAYLIAPVMSIASHIPGLNRIAKYIERNLIVSLYIPDIRWRILDTFDAITPSIASTHTGKEVNKWMEQAGCINLKTTNWCETSVTGIRS